MTSSTGHALPPPNPEGPFPLNLSLAPGDASVEDMIASTKRGLLVTRFHYSNIVLPMESVITGMTRDGTWLIADDGQRYLDLVAGIAVVSLGHCHPAQL